MSAKVWTEAGLKAAIANAKHCATCGQRAEIAAYALALRRALKRIDKMTKIENGFSVTHGWREVQPIVDRALGSKAKRGAK